MPVISRGNLTVEHIRQQRFDVACERLSRVEPAAERTHTPRAMPATGDPPTHQPDRVELSPQALAYEPWSAQAQALSRVLQSEACRMDTGEQALPRPAGAAPGMISPVTGSQALSGLGTALIVPGTLLDVVA